MSSNNRRTSRESVLAAILSQENFWPAEPQSLRDTGLPVSFIEALICKRLAVVGFSTGRQLAKTLCLPFQLLADMYQTLRERQIIVHKGSAPLNDYTYSLTEKGRERARAEAKSCSYIGPAPVPLVDYVVSVEAQTIRAESPKRKQLENAFRDISVNRDIFETLGPAVNSGAGLFLYGEPGNGKTTLAKRVIRCFGQQVWVPHAVIDDGQIIKV
ncbi:MAG: AAA family ATPase, partial [Planctomycetota bacterium]